MSLDGCARLEILAQTDARLKAAEARPRGAISLLQRVARDRGRMLCLVIGAVQRHRRLIKVGSDETEFSGLLHNTETDARYLAQHHFALRILA
jgi:hypothetical protein